MIEQAILNYNEDKTPAVIKWVEAFEDFTVEGIDGITRSELIELVDEIKYLTHLEN